MRMPKKYQSRTQAQHTHTNRHTVVVVPFLHSEKFE